MKKILNYMKNNKLFSLLIILFVLILMMIIVAIKVLIFPSYSFSKYGNRLDGIESIKISDSRINEVLSLIDAKDGITYKSYRLSGKIVNLFFNADNSVSIDDVKKYANDFVAGFNESELSYYDFQVFIKRNGESSLIGYKNKISSELSWNYEGEN